MKAATVEQKRYVDIMARAALLSMYNTADPLGSLRETVATIIADQAEATDAAIRAVLPRQEATWYREKGKAAIANAHPSFSAYVGFIVDDAEVEA